MRYMVSLSEFRNTLTHTLHHGCNIPIRDKRKLGVDDRSPGPAPSKVLRWVSRSDTDRRPRRLPGQ
jgi:hypothetical protein